jgi:membrane protein required for colicin V production
MRNPPVLQSLTAFDIAVIAAAITTAMTGFNAGLLRSLAVILGYVSAMPLAVAVTARLAPAADGAAGGMPFHLPWGQNLELFVGIFLVAGLLIGALLKFAVNDLFGPSVHLADRLAGSLLGVIRVTLVAIAVVAAFDRIVPDARQPAYLRQSMLRPALSRAGLAGLRSLPPDLASAIDQLKKDRRI